MLPFKLVYSDGYYLPIGQHVFPAEKYRLVRNRLVETAVAGPEDFINPQPASDQDILLVHTPQYVNKLKTGTLSAREELELEVPFSPELVKAFWLSAGGSILAAQHALNDGVAFNIGGGFHHAFPDHGEGFCMIHDVAVAIRRMQRDSKIRTAMTVDCDVHHGNGTAAIFAGTRTTSEALPSCGPSVLGRKPLMRGSHAGDVFTISLHQVNNYPPTKPPSSIDVDLPDGISDDDYLAWLDNALSSGLRQFKPDLICYIAGADPYREDQLGGLGLTIEGLKKRDELVFRVARAQGIPVMVTYAGGYARNVADTVTIHSNTVIAAKDSVRERKAGLESIALKRERHSKEENMPTQRVTVVYPNQDGSKFDFDYYMQKHIPWVASLVGSKIEVRRGISSAAGSAAPYVCIATIAANIAEFQSVFAEHGEEILADVPKYTNIEPIVQFDEILGELESPQVKAAS